MIKIKILKQILTVLLSILILLFLNEGKVRASLQSNPNTQYIKSDIAVNWISEFRKMETKGETMGLSEILDTDLSAMSESNNIDVHMIRTIEYGATAILSASGYGNNEKVITTTTGNDTGVIFKIGTWGIWENTAGKIEGTTKFSEINERYYDTYKGVTTTTAKVGDAVGDSKSINPGCASWHGADYYRWRNGDGNAWDLGRGGESIFSYESPRTGGPLYWNPNSSYCRGVVVCGAGI